MIEFQTYEDFCEAFKRNDINKNSAQKLFLIRNNFSMLKNLDTNENGYITFDDLVDTRADFEPEDYLESAVQKMSKVFDYIAENMRSKIIRENVLMPIYMANEFNGKSILWLSKRAGRTVREKLSGTRSIMAVRRRLVLDTAENQLFKEFSRRLEEFIFLKNSCLPAELQNYSEQIFFDKLQRFRHSPEVEEISAWNNPPPNNTLLSDKCYNSVWRAWNDFQKINSLIIDDCRNIDERLCTLAEIFLIKIIGRRFDFPQLPVIYENPVRRIRFLNEKIFAVNPDTDEILKITPLDTEIFLEYRNKICKIKSSSGLLHISKEGGGSIINSPQRMFMGILKAVASLTDENLLRAKQKVEVNRIDGNTATVNLFPIRAEVFADGEYMTTPGILMYAQIFDGDKKFLCNCFKSRALAISDSIKFSTFSGIVSADFGENSEPLKKLAESLNDFVHTENITLVYPDVYSEFQLADLKKTSKLFYHKVRAVPKSLAAIFSYVQSDHFRENFNFGDFIIVVNKTDYGFTLVLIKSLFDKNAAQDIPELKGIVFEHHPAFFVEKNFLENVNLSDAAKKLLTVMSAEDFICVAEEIKFIDDCGNLIDFSNDVDELENISAPIKFELEKYISDKHLQGKKIWLMPLNAEIDCEGTDFEIIDYSEQDILDGVDFFDDLCTQTKVSLWRDCLPDLSIKRLYKTFDLVKNSTLEYGDQTEILIPIPGGRTFTLPKGRKIYRFGLQMSAGNEKTFFEAVIEHKNFPLKDDTECRLIMKYNYADDNPYSLKFVPLNRSAAGFNEAVVKWERVEGFNFKNLPYPKFPPTKTLDELRHLKHKYDKGTDNILKKVISRLQEIATPAPKIIVNPDRYALITTKNNVEVSYTENFVDGVKSVIFSAVKTFKADDGEIYGRLKPTNDARFTLDVSKEKWFTNSKGDRQLIAVFEFEGQTYEVSFFKSKFIFQSDADANPKYLNFAVNTDKLQTGKLVYAGNIIAVDSANSTVKFFKVGKLLPTPYDFNQVNNLISGLLFGLHEIYFNGREIEEPELARDLREGLANVYKMYREIAENNLNIEVRDKLFNVLCVASKDIDLNFIDAVKGYIFECSLNDIIARYEIGFVLGDFSTDIQRNLFERIRMLDERNIIGILSKAAWRNENFIKNFPLELTKKYFEVAINLVVEKKGDKSILITALEFILAVFRLREDADENLSRYLSLNNPLLRKLYKTLEKFIAKKFFDEVKTRIEINVNQSVEFQRYNIPNLFYALLVYITGEQGESDIIISSVNA